METEYEKLQQRAENNVEIIIKKHCSCTTLTFKFT